MNLMEGVDLMKRRVSLFICVILIFSILPQAEAGPLSWDTGMDTEGFLASLNDWILGTDWGILTGSIDPEGRTLKFILSKQSLDALTLQDEKDIREAMLDMLSLYLPSREAAGMFSILNQAGDAALMEERQEPDRETAAGIAPQGQTEAARTNLVFIHHRVGENWLRQGLAQTLNDHGYHVADITYGWREYGDYTDTRDWPGWFTDGVMALVYRELGTMSVENSLEPANGENTVILFKSCFPNSDTGSSIDDEKTVYNSLLPYF